MASVKSLLTSGTLTSCMKKALCFKRNQGILKLESIVGSHFFCTKAEEVIEDNKVEELPRHPAVDVDTSIRYMNSKAYSTTYGNVEVWRPYRRNHKGHIPPTKIRYSCITRNKVFSGNPCPICRDDHLVLHPKNSALLQQFISPQTGQIISNHITNLCMKQQRNLNIAMQQAWDQGTVMKHLPFKKFNYEDYYPQLKKKSESNSS